MQQHVYSISNALAQYGVQHVLICPGSRSAPLVAAFSSNNHFTCHTVIDERSAGYIALGMAQQLRKPVVVICTSGTAVANLYPAVAEAFYQHIPLILLTADRPLELLNQQDGQMIQQQDIFGAHVLFSGSVTDKGPEYNMLKMAGSITAKAYMAATGIPNGPVHLNIPLREPLYASSKEKPSHIPAPPKVSEKTFQTRVSLNSLRQDWQNAGKRMVILGQHPVSAELFSSLYRLSSSQECVVVCDPVSNQFSFNTAPRFDRMIEMADLKTLKLLRPEIIVSAGGPLVSKSLKTWLKDFKPSAHYRIQSEPFNVDTYGHHPVYLKTTAMDAIAAITGLRGHKPESVTAYYKLWQTSDLLAGNAIDSYLTRPGYSELKTVWQILQQVPDAVNLQIANSSIIRYVSLLGYLNPSWTVNGNRGTSGIDGCTSTAVGAAAVNNKLTVLITGDLGFLYDRNAFWNKLVKNNLRIIVINNQGGGIFSLIDGPGKQPNLLPYFTTPHFGRMQSIAREYDLEYYFCNSLPDLNSLLKKFFEPGNKSALLEIASDMKQNAASFKQFKKIKS